MIVMYSYDAAAIQRARARESEHNGSTCRLTVAVCTEILNRQSVLRVVSHSLAWHGLEAILSV